LRYHLLGAVLSLHRKIFFNLAWWIYHHLTIEFDKTCELLWGCFIEMDCIVILVCR
jgi:hypothetical protein